MAALTAMFLAGAAALNLFGEDLTVLAMVPDGEFAQQDSLAANAYAAPDMWLSHPGMDRASDPARWQPPRHAALAGGDGPGFAVFFVHPTSYFEANAWNAPLADAASQERAQLMVRGLASAFNQASQIWVPRYRQATFGAFLTDAPAATMAIDAAHRDVAQAFDHFLHSVPANMPLVLAGHSQGAYHVTRLLHERRSDSELIARIAAAYPIGWPISVRHDLPQLPLPACNHARATGCILGYTSFAEPADPGLLLRRYAMTPGLDGQPRGTSAILCVNPLTGSRDGAAGMARNLGTLVPQADFSAGELVAGAVPARCDTRGLLLIGNPPNMGNLAFPGNNYHLVDIPLFWQNLRSDLHTRIGQWPAAHS